MIKYIQKLLTDGIFRAIFKALMILIIGLCVLKLAGDS